MVFFSSNFGTDEEKDSKKGIKILFALIAASSNFSAYHFRISRCTLESETPPEW